LNYRHRQPGRLDQAVQVAFGGGPDAVGHLGQDRTELRRAFDRPVAEFLG
jgi:hypothetical protein